MKRVIFLLILCAVLAVSGCGGSPEAATAPDPTGQPAEPAVIEIQPDKGEAPAPAQQAPAELAVAEVVFTPLAVGAETHDDGTTVTITGGPGELTVSGGAWNRTIVLDEGASIRLALQNGAAFTGTVQGGGMADVSVALDASSTWTLVADVSVGVIVNADPTFANVQSGGFSIEYNAEAGENAYLAGAAKQLPGGGFLTPLI